MSDVPVSSSAHARKVQILVWSGTASITVAQTLLALMAYLKLEGGSTVVPGLDRWQVMHAGHVLISLTCLLLLIPVLRGPRPSLSILIVFLGLIPTWPQVAASVSATVIGMRKGAKAIPVVVAVMVVGVSMSPLLNPIREEATLSAVASYAVSSLPICIVCVMLGVNLQAREELAQLASGVGGEGVDAARDLADAAQIQVGAGLKRAGVEGDQGEAVGEGVVHLAGDAGAFLGAALGDARLLRGADEAGLAGGRAQQLLTGLQVDAQHDADDADRETTDCV